MGTDNKIIGATIKVDTGSASASVKGFTKDLKDTKGALKDTGAAATGAGKDISQSAGHFSNLRSQLTAMPGALGGAASGVGSLNNAFKLLLANPVGAVIIAIVGALSLLYKAFTSTNSGADQMEQIFTGLKAIGEVVLNTILKLAGAIGKLFSGDFSGAFADAKAAVTGFGDAAVAAFNAAADAARRMQEVEDAMRELGVSRAKLNRDLAETKEILSDENSTLEEKRKAIERVREAEGKQTADELKAARDKLTALQQLHKAGDGDVSDDELQAEADAQAAIYQLEEKSATNIRSLNKQERSFEKQEREKAREERQKAIEQQKKDEQLLHEFTQKLNTLKADNQLRAIKDETERDKAALENKIAAEKQGIARQLLEKKITRAQADQLNAALDINSELQRTALTEKQNAEKIKKEEEFQKELLTLTNKLKLSGMTDARQIEKVQLEIDAEEKLKEAAIQYKNDQTQFLEIKSKIDAQLALDQEKLDKKNKKEDLDKNLKPDDKIKSTDFDARKAELDADVLLLQQSFDQKLISEEYYTTKTKELADRRKKIKDEERAHHDTVVSIISSTLGNLSTIAGKQTKLGQTFAKAQVLVDTYAGAISAYKSLSGIPFVGPALGGIAAAAAIKTGLDAFKKISAVDIPGQGSGGGSAPSAPLITTSAPVAPIAQSTKIIPSGDETQQQSIRAHVVHEDSQAAAARERRLRNASVLGGNSNNN